MRAQVHQYVSECIICQRAKPDRTEYPGLLAALPVPILENAYHGFCGGCSKIWPNQLLFSGG